MSDDYTRIQTEKKARYEAEYRGGWREGWTKAKQGEEICIKDTASAYGVGLSEGFEAPYARAWG